MSHRHFDYNWRATMGNADALSADVAAYLDLAASLAQDDGFYPTMTANYHTCALDDPMPMLHYMHRQNLVETIADHRLYDKALAEVRRHRLACYSDAEVERRLAQADGDCPMCGFRIVWHGANSQNVSTQMTHCQHNLGHQVPSDGVDAYLRRANSWHGKHWPVAFMQGHRLRASHGDPQQHTAPCSGCLQMEATERTEQALLRLVTTPGAERFAKPGWGSPVSAYKGLPDDHVYMRVKRTVQETNNGWSSRELRLNDAGLKLYLQPVRAGRGLREVDCGMRVGGDQVNDYPGFREFAHEIFAEMNVLSGNAAA
jgi:hypothetical protein